MIASNDHGQPSLAPRCTCGELLTLPQVYLDLMFGEPETYAAEADTNMKALPELLLAAE